VERRLLPTPVPLPTPPPSPHPQVVLPHRPDVNIEGAAVAAKYIIVNERANATTRVVLHRLPAGAPLPSGALGPGQVIKFDEAVYTLSGREWRARRRPARARAWS
jgi:protease II